MPSKNKRKGEANNDSSDSGVSLISVFDKSGLRAFYTPFQRDFHHFAFVFSRGVTTAVLTTVGNGNGKWWSFAAINFTIDSGLLFEFSIDQQTPSYTIKS